MQSVGMTMDALDEVHQHAPGVTGARSGDRGEETRVAHEPVETVERTPGEGQRQEPGT